MYGFENFDNEYAFGTGMSSKEKEKEKEARHRGTGDMVWDQPKFWELYQKGARISYSSQLSDQIILLQTWSFGMIRRVLIILDWFRDQNSSPETRKPWIFQWNQGFPCKLWPYTNPSNLPIGGTMEHEVIFAGLL